MTPDPNRLEASSTAEQEVERTVPVEIAAEGSLPMPEASTPISRDNPAPVALEPIAAVEPNTLITVPYSDGVDVPSAVDKDEAPTTIRGGDLAVKQEEESQEQNKPATETEAIELPGSSEGVVTTNQVHQPTRGGRTSANGGPSPYRGVVWHKSNNKWEARIYEQGKQRFLGYFTVEDAAAIAYDDHAVRLHGCAAKLNFPERFKGVKLPPPQRNLNKNSGPLPPQRTSQRPRPSPPVRFQDPDASDGAHSLRAIPMYGGVSVQQVQPSTKGSSRYRGVSWNSSCGKWRAQVWKNSEVHHLGYFDVEEDAARAYDEAVAHMRGPEAPVPNLPRSSENNRVADVEEIDTYWARKSGMHAVPPRPSNQSQTLKQMSHGEYRRQTTRLTNAHNDRGGMRGVFWSDSMNAWVAEIWDGERYARLGSYPTETAAARAYDLACVERHGSQALTNFPLFQYETELAAIALRDLAADSEEGGSTAAAADPQGGDHQDGAAVASHDDISNATLFDPRAGRSGGFSRFQNKPAPIAVAGNAASANTTGSHYLGVTYDPRKGKWLAQIQYCGQWHFLGHFDSETGAATAYDVAAARLHGDQAVLNYPRGGGGGRGGGPDANEPLTLSLSNILSHPPPPPVPHVSSSSFPLNHQGYPLGRSVTSPSQMDASFAAGLNVPAGGSTHRSTHPSLPSTHTGGARGGGGGFQQSGGGPFGGALGSPVGAPNNYQQQPQHVQHAQQPQQQQRATLDDFSQDESIRMLSAKLQELIAHQVRMQEHQRSMANTQQALMAVVDSLRNRIGSGGKGAAMPTGPAPASAHHQPRHPYHQQQQIVHTLYPRVPGSGGEGEGGGSYTAPPHSAADASAGIPRYESSKSAAARDSLNLAKRAYAEFAEAAHAQQMEKRQRAMGDRL